MDTLFTIFLIIHIIGGGIGLLVGIATISGKKGTKKHKRLGKIFAYGMLTAGGSSLILSWLHPSLFMFMVGLFTVYMVLTGVRYLRFTQSNSKNTPISPHIIDWILTGIMGIASLAFLFLGARSIVAGNLFGSVFLTFAIFGILYVKNDIQNFTGKSALQNFGLTEHIQRMTGGFIASSTAFLVVNAKFFPEFIPLFVYWLLPTVVITPLIVKWTNKFKILKKV